MRTRVEAHAHKVGVQYVTYADKLLVKGGECLPPDLREAVAEHRAELLAAACVLAPPVPWVAALVENCRAGRARLAMLAANAAAFVGLHPTHDGARLQPVIEEALR